MSLDDKFETQCWICPKCHDDHVGDKCTHASNMEFMPVDDDKSYIAKEYRARVAERDQLKADYLALTKRMDEYLTDYNKLNASAIQMRIELERERAENAKLKAVLKSRCFCDDLGYYGSSGPCRVCKALLGDSEGKVSDDRQ